MPKYAFIGMSHLVAVMKAAFGARNPVELWGWAGQLQGDFSLYRLEPEPDGLWPFDSVFHVVHPRRTWGDRPPLSDAPDELAAHPHLERFAQLARDEGRTVISYLYGSGHCAGIFRSQPEIDFVVPTAPHLPVEPDCRLLPYDAAVARMPDALLTARLLLFLRYYTRQPVIHLLPPPPIPDERVFHEHRESWSERDLARGINSRWKRLKYYLAYCDAVVQKLPPDQVRVIGTPAAACDADGFLRQDLWAYSTHASAEFGAMLLEQLRCET